MNGLSVCVLLLMATAPAFPQQKSCAELAAEIAAQLDAKGVKAYQLDIVDADEVRDQQVVGTCEGGARKITYRKIATVKSGNSQKASVSQRSAMRPRRGE
jgi:hypothetical protein